MNKSIEEMLKEESEVFTGSSFDRIKNQIEVKKPSKSPRFNKKWYLFIAGSSLLTAALVVAIVLPLSLINDNEASSVRMVISSNINTNNIKYKLTSTNDSNIDIYYTVTNKGLVNPQSYECNTDNTKMVIAAIKNDKVNYEESTSKFSNRLLEYSNDCFIYKDNTYKLNLNVTSSSKKTIDNLIKEINKTIDDFSISSGIDFNVTITSYITKKNSNEDIKETILVRASNLFYTPRGGLKGYVPEALEDKTFNQEDWLTYLPENKDELLKIKDRLDNLDMLESDKNYSYFQEVLTSMNIAYNGRRDEIINQINQLDNEVKTKHQELLDRYEMGYSKLLSPSWWNNQYQNKKIEDINFYKDHPHDDMDKKDPIKEKEELLNLLEMNQIWFANSLEIATQKERPEDDGFMHNDTPWWGDNDFNDHPNDGSSSWDEYWLHQYENHKNPGH